MSLSYFKTLTDDQGRVFSVDNIRVKFQIEPLYKDRFVEYLSPEGRTDITAAPICYKDFKFKHFVNITYAPDCVATLAFVFNGPNHKKDSLSGYLDVNPNKVGSFRQFWRDYRCLKACCESWFIDRWDVALDIPVSRENVILCKDQRNFSIVYKSAADNTEYLGRRSHVGYVKVYNKKIESDLNYDLTRVEVTCEPTYESYIKNFPKVCNFFQDPQLGLDMLSLSETDQTILRMELALLGSNNDPGLHFFNGLGRDKKQKLRPFLLPESCFVNPCSVRNLPDFLKEVYESF